MGQCLSPGETTVELDILGAHLDIRVRAAYMSARQGPQGARQTLRTVPDGYGTSR